MLLQAKKIAQRQLHTMQGNWRKAKAVELPEAADKHNTEALYEELRAVFNPPTRGPTPILSPDRNSLLTDK